MVRLNSLWARLAFGLGTILFYAILSPTLGHAAPKKDPPSVRWTAGALGCTFERRDDGKYAWTMTERDRTVTLLMDSQELAKSGHRFYRLFGAYISVTYMGQDKFEFPAGARIDFVRHHDVVEGYEDPGQLANKLQNDVDTKVFETERQIKKNPKIAEEKTALLRQYQKEAAEFIEFLSTQTLPSDTVILNPGNPETPWLGSVQDQQQVDRAMEGARGLYSQRWDDGQDLAISVFVAADRRRLDPAQAARVSGSEHIGKLCYSFVLVVLDHR
jgi:hypothetical protein